MQGMRCHRCGQEMEFKVVQLVEVTKAGQPVIIQGVPAKVCPNCGEQVFSQAVAQTLLAILTGERQPDGTVILELPVYTMGDKQD